MRVFPDGRCEAMARRVGPSKEPFGDGGVGIPVSIAPLLVRAVLSQNFDPPRIVGYNNDVAVGMCRTGDIRRRLLRLLASSGVPVPGIVVLFWGLIPFAYQRHWRWVANVVYRVF